MWRRAFDRIMRLGSAFRVSRIEDARPYSDYHFITRKLNSRSPIATNTANLQRNLA
jgi:hypothetical protein